MLKRTPLAIAIAMLVNAPHAFAEAENSAATDEAERISVTGSRIARINVETTAPVLVLEADQLKISGDMNLNDVLTSLPQFAQGIDSESSDYNPNNAGLSVPNLRGLGTKRTLTLINGQRPVATINGAKEFVVDVGQIPAVLIDRIEILSGGASSVYGSDAVAGVVNIILNTEYEGIRVDAQANGTERGDGESKSLSLTAGLNFDNDRGNVSFSITHKANNAIKYKDRPNSYGQSFMGDNPLDPNGKIPGIPNNISYSGVNWPDYNLTRPTLLTAATGDFYQFKEDGEGNLTEGFLAVPSDEIFNGYRTLNPYGFSSQGPNQYLTPSDTTSVYLASNYQFDDFELTADIRYSKVNAFHTIDPEYLYAWDHWQDIYNPTIPIPEAVDELVRGFEDTPAYDGGWITMPYTFNAIGNRETDVDRQFLSFAIGASGDLDNGWTWDVYASTGGSEIEQANYNNIRRDYINWDYNLIGPCADTNSCGYINPFNVNEMDQAVMDYITIDVNDHTDITETKQTNFQANLSGDLYELPAGALAFSTGIEYRKEELDISPSIASIEGWDGNSSQELNVDRDVTEAYVELLVPVLSDIAFVEELTVETAIRFANYSDTESDESWKFAANWRIDENVIIRANISEAVRAPQLIELYAPSDTQWARGLDPCDATQIADLEGEKRQTRSSNCAALGLPADYNSGFDVSGGLYATKKGNEDLRSEKARTLTVGLGLTPTFIEGLTINIDYYDIELEDGISTFGAFSTMTQCVDSSTIDNDFCRKVTRDPVTGVPTDVVITYINANLLTRTGYDLDVAYDMDLSSGATLALNFFASKTLEDSYQESEATGAKVFDYAGIVSGNPDFAGTFTARYTLDALSASWSMSHISDSFVSIGANAETHDRYEVPSATLHHARVDFELGDSSSVYIGVNNVMDKLWTDHPYGVGYGRYPLYGRSYYAGVSVEF